mmetsp:Transcript_4068/g.6109  ORF Transcript_4068/g.6109 Transcript_4068/m.6109 type:complete len:160 (-) Transcript_4068:38-517(-)
MFSINTLLNCIDFSYPLVNVTAVFAYPFTLPEFGCLLFLNCLLFCSLLFSKYVQTSCGGGGDRCSWHKRSGATTGCECTCGSRKAYKKEGKDGKDGLHFSVVVVVVFILRKVVVMIKMCKIPMRDGRTRQEEEKGAECVEKNTQTETMIDVTDVEIRMC